MSSPILLNLRVLKQQKNTIFIGLSHFGTDSRIVFQCEYAPDQVAKWGALPIEISGRPFSYFGQFIGELALNSQPIVFSQLAASQISDYQKRQITALASGLSYLLNEFHATKLAESHVTPSNVDDALNDQVFILAPEPGNKDMVVSFLPLGVNQHDFSVAQAQVHPVFNHNVPAHIIDGMNKDGVIPDVLEHVASK